MATLNAATRDLLIEHIDGPVLIRVNEPARYNRIRGLIQCGWLSCDGHRPARITQLTERGRGILAHALASWADALVKANAKSLEVHNVRFLEAAE